MINYLLLHKASHSSHQKSNNTTRRTQTSRRALERHSRARRRLHPTSHASRAPVSSSTVSAGRSNGRSRRGGSLAREKPTAETVAAASVERALRVVGAGGVEVAAHADGEGCCSVAAGAVLALRVVGAGFAKVERVGGSSDRCLAGGLAACCADDEGGSRCGGWRCRCRCGACCGVCVGGR